MKLNQPNCYISPTLETINKQFTLVSAMTIPVLFLRLHKWAE